MRFNIKFLFKSVVLSVISLNLLYLSGCISPEKIQEPGELTKDIKIEESANIDIPAELKDIDAIKKKLAEKIVIPAKRETNDFVDPFIAKSIKGIELLKNKQKSTENKETKSNIQNLAQNQEQKQSTDQTNQQNNQQSTTPVNLATESISMFTYEGILTTSNEKRAILRHSPTNRSYIVTVGTVVGGYKITDIQDNNLILVMGSEKLVIPKNKK
ncbi:MAG: hypothetical protein ACPL1F_05030 [bacterium]